MEQESEYLSKEGLEKLKEKIDALKKKRKEIAERIEQAKSLGDLSENAEYQEAKEEQLANESQIAEFEDVLRRAVIFSESKGGGAFVRIGSTVVVKKEDSGSTFQYSIVGSEEADPASNKVSNESPLGRAFLGKKAGDVVDVLTPRGAAKYRIKEVL